MNGHGEEQVHINTLVSSYIRNAISNNWHVVEDIVYRLDTSTPSYDDDGPFRYLNHKIEALPIDRIRVYTQDERGYDREENPIDRDTAAEYIVLACEKGAFWQGRESRVMFMKTVENGVTYKGSQVVAVFIGYDIGEFIVDAQVNPSDDRADIYLVQPDGIIVAQYEKAYVETPYSLGAATLSAAESCCSNT